MKLYIKSTEEVKDAQSKRTDNDKAAIEVMKSLEEYQGSPQVGIFWYSPVFNKLFGVCSTLASSLTWRKSSQFEAEIKTDGRLHKDIWKKKSRQSGDSLFVGDYTRIPRGRIFEFKDGGFKVYVGDWIDEYPQAKSLIIDEFDLPKDVKFVKDVHWDLGHGWSDEF